MGLKTTNYTTKGTNILLKDAYAVLKNLIVESDNSVRAIFSIQQNRESAEKAVSLEKVEINFVWDRKTDPAKMAYEIAKVYTIQEGEEEIPCSLYGWDNDIIVKEGE